MLPRRPFPIGGRGATLLVIAAVAWLAARWLDLELTGLVPRESGRILARDLFGAALHPALGYQTEVPPGTPAFGVKIASALWSTILVAAAAMSLALPGGVLLGALSSDIFWIRGASSGKERVAAAWRVLQVGARVLASMLRAVHELLWAVLFLAAIGLSSASAVIAIALPFTGVIAKVTSELFDEAPRTPWRALRLAGAGPSAAWAVGIAPAALPDALAYGFYRFECALRSAAVLGFFGVPTIGMAVAQSFENLQYQEMWTYLYSLVALVLVAERISATARRRLRT